MEGTRKDLMGQNTPQDELSCIEEQREEKEFNTRTQHLKGPPLFVDVLFQEFY